MTKNAEQILAIINASHEHLSAEQIFFHLKETNKSVVLATVYNNFILLVQTRSYPKNFGGRLS